jgi:hypothetical protein
VQELSTFYVAIKGARRIQIATLNIGRKGYVRIQEIAMSEPDIPAYISRKRAARQLDMSPDTFDNYVRKGVLPEPKRRGRGGSGRKATPSMVSAPRAW